MYIEFESLQFIFTEHEKYSKVHFYITWKKKKASIYIFFLNGAEVDNSAKKKLGW